MAQPKTLHACIDCGKPRWVTTYNVRRKSGRCKGCASRKSHLRHGECGTPTYGVWLNMNQRCTDPKCPKFPRYGGRGITVCRRWRHSYQNFRADMGVRPPGMTLDRKNNNGNYTPNNCRWATQKAQQNNRSNNRRK